MNFSLLPFLILLFLLFLVFIFGRLRGSAQGQGRKYRGRTLQDDNLSILTPPIVPYTTTDYVPIDDYSHHTAGDHTGTVDSSPGDFGNSWDSSTSVDTSTSDFGGFDSGGGDLGSALASEIGGGSDFGGSDFGGGSDGSDGGSF